MEVLPKIILKKGREKSLLRRHPWVFSGAVERTEGEISPGDLGEVYSATGQWLGIGHLNPKSQIFFRLLSARKEEIGASFFSERILRALRLREQWLKDPMDVYRMVNGEGDFLPGLIIDRYRDVFVVQFLTAGMDHLKQFLVDFLVSRFDSASIYERSDVTMRREEGLPESRGLLHGEEVPDWIEIEEGDCRFRINVKEGQKTGFYMDQRANRQRLRRVSLGKSILDVCCYTGSFSIHAGLGGAKEVTLVDSSQEALEMAEVHFRLNRLEGIPRRLVRGNAFDVMRGLQPEYDIIILDPPPFAKKKSALPRASRGYKDLNLQAFRLLRPEGFLFTFSCSHHMDWDLFQKVVFAAAVDAGKEVQLLGRMSHPVDHPVNLCHPEGEYLKGFVLYIE
jgi:23S rRNA (cytosine1962-C5)-methyltransferase